MLIKSKIGSGKPSLLVSDFGGKDVCNSVVVISGPQLFPGRPANPEVSGGFGRIAAIPDAADLPRVTLILDRPARIRQVWKQFLQPLQFGLRRRRLALFRQTSSRLSVT